MSIAFAVGMRRTLHPGPAGTWGPLLVGLFGLGLVVGGIFVTDPDLGYPPDIPTPAEHSWHATAHNIGPGVAFDALIVACLVLARRFAVLRHAAWATYCAMTAAVVLLLTWWPERSSISIRLALAVVVAFVWLTALASRLIRESSSNKPEARGET